MAEPKTDGQGFLLVWEIIAAVAVLFVSFSIPMTLGFEKMYIENEAITYIDSDQCLFRQASQDGSLYMVFRWIDPFVDVIFLIDIAVNFLSARWELQAEPTPHWVLLDNLDEIAGMYLRGTFILDFLGALPTQYLHCVSQAPPEGDPPHSAIKALRLIRITKVPNLKSARRAITTVFRILALLPAY
jgi:hypothetical protein